MRYNKDLTHYGVLGMHWGIRKDGKRGSSRTPRSSRRTDRARAKTMSDEELRKVIDRMQLEKRYVDVLHEERSSGTISKGSKVVAGMVGSAVALSVNKQVQRAVGRAVDVAIETAKNKIRGK